MKTNIPKILLALTIIITCTISSCTNNGKYDSSSTDEDNREENSGVTDTNPDMNRNGDTTMNTIDSVH